MSFYPTRRDVLLLLTRLTKSVIFYKTFGFDLVWAGSTKPNVILILADDLGYGDLSCYGATKIATPRLDALAAEGVRFTDAHAPSSVCIPSRYGILAGRYHWRDVKAAYRKDYQIIFEDNQLTLPSLLKSAGYNTAMLGKWDSGFGSFGPEWNGELKPGPLEIGFDYFFGIPRPHNEPPYVFIENYRVVGLDKDDPIRVLSTSDVMHWDGSFEGGARARAARPQDQIDLILTNKAVEYIDRQKADVPFFLYMAFVAPHVPLLPSKAFQGSSRAGLYGDFVQQLDWCVGRIMDELTLKGIAENTLVLFTSDNGAQLHPEVLQNGHRSNGMLLGQKTDAWDGGHKVPLIASWPGKIPCDKVVDQLFSLTDLVATIAAASEVSLPTGSAIDSLNQLDLLIRPETAPTVRTEMLYYAAEGYALHLLSLRSGDWVYLPQQGSLGYTAHPTKSWGLPYNQLGFVNSDLDEQGKPLPNTPPAQLYNVRLDPGQRVNRYRDEPAIVERLSRRLSEFLSLMPIQ